VITLKRGYSAFRHAGSTVSGKPVRPVKLSRCLGVLTRRLSRHQLAQLAESNLCIAQRAFGLRSFCGIARESVRWLDEEPAHRRSRFPCLAANISRQPRAAVEMLTHLLGQICAAARAQVRTIPYEIGRKLFLSEILSAAGALGDRVVEAVVK
jgi:hypothetical protein